MADTTNLLVHSCSQLLNVILPCSLKISDVRDKVFDISITISSKTRACNFNTL